MKPKLKYVLLIFILGVFSWLSFQNCSNNGFQAVEYVQGNFASIGHLPPTGGEETGLESGFVDPAKAGQMDSRCLSPSSPYDACLFLKNPVAQKGSALSSFPTFQSAELTSLQTFGVQLTNLIDPARLQSSSLDVYFSGNNFENRFRVQLKDGQFKQSYASDGGPLSTSGNQKTTAQLMAYFWLNYQGSELLRRTGISWSWNKKTLVDAYSNDDANLGTGIQNNAYFTYSADLNTDRVVSGRYIVMGYAQAPGSNANSHEMALSADVYSHEMGHGNLLAAAGSQINHDYENTKWLTRVVTCSKEKTREGNLMVMSQAQIDSLRLICAPNDSPFQNPASNDGALTNFQIERINSFCKNPMGCIDAINEGQADFHYLMMFPLQTALGETIGNNINGASEFDFDPIRAQTATTEGCDTVSTHAGVPRNVSQISSAWNIDDFFLGSAVQVSNCSIKGEVHGMGSFYAKILWEIYRNPATDKRAFERTFQRHLSALTHSANFSSAKGNLLADDMANEKSRNYFIINSVFSSKGVP